MAEPDALDAALALFKDPVRARNLPGRPLPPDVGRLLAIAVGEEEALATASRRSGFTRQPLQEAAGFFIEQALLCRDADSYRVLGGGPQSTHEELRHNMALLMRWLHPDLQAQRRGPLDREVFAARVSRAWEDLKTPERREAYELRRPPAPSAGTRAGAGRPPGSNGARTNGAGPGGSKPGAARPNAAKVPSGKTRASKAGTRAPNGGGPGTNGSRPGGAGAGSGLSRRPLPLSVHRLEEPSLWVRLWGLLWGRR